MEDAGESVRVFMLDYGNTELVGKPEVGGLGADLLAIPPQALLLQPHPPLPQRSLRFLLRNDASISMKAASFHDNVTVGRTNVESLQRGLPDQLLVARLLEALAKPPGFKAELLAVTAANALLPLAQALPR